MTFKSYDAIEMKTFKYYGIIIEHIFDSDPWAILAIILVNNESS